MNDNTPAVPGAVYQDGKGRWRRTPAHTERRLLTPRQVAPLLLDWLRDHGLAGDVPACDLADYIEWHAAEAGLCVLPYELLRPAIGAEPGVLELRPRIATGERWAPLRRYLARRAMGHIDRPVVLRIPTYDDLAAEAEQRAAKPPPRRARKRVLEPRRVDPRRKAA